MRTRRAVTVAAIVAAGALTPLIPAGLAGAAGQQEPVYGQASAPIVDQALWAGPGRCQRAVSTPCTRRATRCRRRHPLRPVRQRRAAGTPGPLPDYCASGGAAAPETGAVNSQPSGLQAMQPYYFPFVTEAPDGVSGHLIGYFDARPKDTDESIVVASSTDNGQTWTYEGTATKFSSRTRATARRATRTTTARVIRS